MTRSFVTQRMARLNSDELALAFCAWIICLKRTKDNEAPAIDAIKIFSAIACHMPDIGAIVQIIFCPFSFISRLKRNRTSEFCPVAGAINASSAQRASRDARVFANDFFEKGSAPPRWAKLKWKLAKGTNGEANGWVQKDELVDPPEVTRAPGHLRVDVHHLSAHHLPSNEISKMYRVAGRRGLGGHAQMKETYACIEDGPYTYQGAQAGGPYDCGLAG
ncbi:hypothetical protein BJ912DRAFT_921600 [Pholiota molesta]|nr:hypothetical protein BJ912DRAFT_921600 [Pholiota molesta]